MENRNSATAGTKFDNSFIEQDEKMRVHTPSLADNSINEIMKKRHNSTER